MSLLLSIARKNIMCKASPQQTLNTDTLGNSKKKIAHACTLHLHGMWLHPHPISLVAHLERIEVQEGLSHPHLPLLELCWLTACRALIEYKDVVLSV